MHGLSLGVVHGAALRCGAVASLVAQALGTWAFEVAGSRLDHQLLFKTFFILQN